MNVLAEAKQEYTRQLVNILYPQIYLGIRSIYDGARVYCEKNGDKNVLKNFQHILSYVPKWNSDRITDEYSRIVKASDCDWLEDLITAVFVSHTKVLTSIKINKKNKKEIELDVPNGPHFIHKCYIECARNIWKKPYLYHHELSNIDLQRNLSDAENIIKDSIVETVRKQLPVRHILKEYLGNDYVDDDDTELDIESSISKNTKENLRMLVKQEIETNMSKNNESNNENYSKVVIDTDYTGDENPTEETIEEIIEKPIIDEIELAEKQSGGDNENTSINIVEDSEDTIDETNENKEDSPIEIDDEKHIDIVVDSFENPEDIDSISEKMIENKSDNPINIVEKTDEIDINTIEKEEDIDVEKPEVVELIEDEEKQVNVESDNSIEREIQLEIANNKKDIEEENIQVDILDKVDSETKDPNIKNIVINLGRDKENDLINRGGSKSERKIKKSDDYSIDILDRSNDDSEDGEFSFFEDAAEY